MSRIEYPATWSALESPSQRYELLLALDDVLRSSCEWDTTAKGFLLDDISAADRPDGIVRGCLLDHDEERLFLALVGAYEAALSEGRPTELMKAAAAELRAQMCLAGVPSAAD